MRHGSQGMYRGVRVSNPTTVAEKIKGGQEAYKQLDSGEELNITWNGDQYEVESIDLGTIRKFDTIKEINEAYDIYICK